MTLTPLTLDKVKLITDLQQGIFSDGWSESMLKEGLACNNLLGYLLCDNQNTVGFITFSISLDTSDLYDLLIAKNFRNRGYAQTLLDKYFEQLKANGVKKSLLEVRKSNICAINLYQKNGYLTIAQRKKYYSDGEDAIVMEKVIL